MKSLSLNARLAAPVLVAIAVLFALFHDKAFTIDDPFFLLQAERVLTAPLDPSGFEIVWGPKLGRASEVSPTGPGMAYLLAPTVALGGQEWLAHATVFGFLALAAVMMVGLARRLGATPAEARLCAIVMSSLPAVLALAGTAMPDIPALAMGLVALERTLAYRSERRSAQAVAMAFAFAAAILIRSHYVMLLPIAAVLLLGADLKARSLSAKLVARRSWPLVAAVALVVTVALLTRDSESGSMNFTTSLAFLKTKALPRHIAGFFFHFVFALPFALGWAALHFRRLSLWIFALALIGLALPLPPKHLWAIPIAAFGATALFDALRDCARSGDPDRVALGLWLLAALPVAIYVHLPAKYLIVSAPAIALLLVFEARALGRVRRRAVLGGLATFGCGLGVAMLVADARLAAVGREAVARMVAPRTAAGRKVYYAGSWGFHWYADRAGALALGADVGAPRRGDFIVFSVTRPGAIKHDRDALERNGILVDRTVDAGPGGRTMDTSIRAGFYSDGYGWLPWWWDDDEIDEFQLWRIDRRFPIREPSDPNLDER